MQPTHLHAVPPPGEEAPHERAKRLQGEANDSAMAIVDHVLGGAANLILEIDHLAGLSVHPGVANELRVMGEEIGRRLATIQAVRGR